MIKVTVIGLGYIGLPTAAIIAGKGHAVIGVDVNENVVNTINKGEIHIKEPALAGLVKHAVDQGLLKAQTKVNSADIFLITVPTPINHDKTANIDYVEKAIESIVSVLKKGDTVIIESTCPVGTTTSFYHKIVGQNSQLKNNIYMAYCPERVLPGNIIYELENNDRVIGGIDKDSTQKAVEFYRLFVKGELLTTTAESAEMCKLTENAYRDVNIAFANEISMICDEVSINPYELIKLANHHPRVNILQPGPGVGGHCIAVDPWFLISAYKDLTHVMHSARQSNLKKTEWVIDSIIKSVNDYSSKNGRNPVVGCLGLAFKANVDDLRESPAMGIYNSLKDQGIDVVACEPNLNHHETIELEDLKNTVEKSDILALLVPHHEFRSIDIPLEKEVLKYCNLN